MGAYGTKAGQHPNAHENFDTEFTVVDSNKRSRSRLHAGMTIVQVQGNGRGDLILRSI